MNHELFNFVSVSTNYEAGLEIDFVVLGRLMCENKKARIDIGIGRKVKFQDNFECISYQSQRLPFSFLGSLKGECNASRLDGESLCLCEMNFVIIIVRWGGLKLFERRADNGRSLESWKW